MIAEYILFKYVDCLELSDESFSQKMCIPHMLKRTFLNLVLTDQIILIMAKLVVVFELVFSLGVSCWAVVIFGRNQIALIS